MKQLYLIEAFEGVRTFDNFSGLYKCLKNAQNSAMRKFSKMCNIDTIRVSAENSNLCFLKMKDRLRWIKIEHEPTHEWRTSKI